MSHAQFKCSTVPRVRVGPKMGHIGNTCMGIIYLEKHVTGKDMKELVVRRTGNNQQKVLLELFGSGLEV